MTAHKEERLHQLDGTSQGVCVCVCVCVLATLTGNEDKQPALRSYSPHPDLFQRKIVRLCLIDFTVIYLVLNENCSHPAQAISEGL